MKYDNTLIEANDAFKKGDYKKAIDLYEIYIKNTDRFHEIVNFNLELSKSRLLENRNLCLLNSKEKIVVYTVNIGDYESVKEPLFIDSSVDYILFTDNKNLVSKNWKIVYLKDDLKDLRRKSRLPKILAHKYLPFYDISIYIDSSFEIKVADVRKMVSDCLGDKNIALYNHYARDCVYEEIEHVRKSKDRSVEEHYCDSAISLYKSINYPIKNGLFENGIIIRRNTKENKILNNMWWNKYSEGCVRDQFYLMYCLYTLKIKVSSIENGFQIRKNDYVNHYKHEYKSYIKKKTINWLIGGDSSKGWAYDNNARRFIRLMPDYKHAIDGDGDRDVAIYFDMLIAKKSKVKAGVKILRVGGPRPLIKAYGSDLKSLKKDLQSFHTIIVLNNHLKSMVDKYHPNVKVIPNGIDLDDFNPSKVKNKNDDFVIGFCGSVSNLEERDIKGIDYLEKSCSKAGFRLISVGRGKDQVRIPHSRIIEDFFSKIDVLVHPVKDGKEGSSNVIMEALALGIPVITTKYSGYHAEYLEDNENVFFVNRNIDEISELLKKLSKNNELLKRVGLSGRIFAERFHDINKISEEYKKIIEEAYLYSKADRKVVLHPFWLPIENTASSRLRCLYPKIEINKSFKKIQAVNYLDSNADVYIITQTCDDDTFTFLEKNKKNVVYDICDRLYEGEKIYPSLDGGFNTTSRFFQLSKIANKIICPTEKLKNELISIFPEKNIICVPDGVDYNANSFDYEWKRSNVVTWFGNVGRGNFESAKWVLDYMVESLGFEPLIITNKNQMKKYPDYYDYTVNWNHDNFIDYLRRSEFVVLSHSNQEQTKSPNRLLVTMALGIPTLVSSSFSMSDILNKADLSSYNINSKDEIYKIVNNMRENFNKSKVYYHKSKAYIYDKVCSLNMERGFLFSDFIEEDNKI